MFDLNAAKQACALLISLSGGGEDYRKIFQLLYLVERKSISETCGSIFEDRFEKFVAYDKDLKAYNFFSPKKLYHLVTCCTVDEIIFEKGNLSFKDNINCALDISGCGVDYGDLSEYDVELITEIYNQYKDFSAKDISNITSEFKENVYISSFDRYQLMKELDIDEKTIGEIRERDEYIDACFSQFGIK
jgi:hypothetical protein